MDFPLNLDRLAVLTSLQIEKLAYSAWKFLEHLATFVQEQQHYDICSYALITIQGDQTSA